MSRRSVLLVAAGADVLVVVAFAAIGRRSHDEAGTAGSILGTAAPFLLGLLVAWLVVGLVVRRRPGPEASLLTVDQGVVLALVTTAVGVIARRTLWDRGIAVAFVVVTAVFLTAGMAGWRALRTWLHVRHGDSRSAAG